MFQRRRGVQCGVKTRRKKNWCKDCSTKDEQRTRGTKTKKAVPSTSCHGCYQTAMLSARRNFTVSLRYYQDIFFALLVRLGQIKLLIYFVFHILALACLEILSEDQGMLDHSDTSKTERKSKRSWIV